MAEAFYLTEADVKYQRKVNRRVMQELTHTDTPGDLPAPRAAATGIWEPLVVKNLRVGTSTAPWGVVFQNARCSCFGVQYFGSRTLYLPSSAVEAETLYIYAVISNTANEPTLRWNLSPLWDHSIQNQFLYRPIRYVGKIKIDDGIFSFSDLPTDTVVFDGGPVDLVRLIAQWEARDQWKYALSATLAPEILMLGRTLFSNLTKGTVDLESIETHHVPLSDYSTFENSIYLIARTNGSRFVVDQLATIGQNGDYRLLAQLNVPDELGFRAISFQEPNYTARTSERQVSFKSATTMRIKQDYIGADAELHTLTRTVTIPLATSPVSVYAHFYYNADTNASYTEFLLSSESPPPEPSGGFVRLSYLIGTIANADIGGAVAQLFYDLITPGFASLRANAINVDLGTKIDTLDLRVTALEQR